MPDTLLAELSALHTVTSTETSNTFYEMPAGAATGPHGVFIRVSYESALLTTGSGTLAFAGQLSYDRGATWVTPPGATGTTINLSTTAQAGEQVLQLMPRSWPPVDTGVVQFQVLATISGTGATCVYKADLMR